MALYDYGVKPSTTMGQILDMISTEGAKDNDWLIPAWMDARLNEAVYGQDILSYIVSGAPIIVTSDTLKAATIDLMSTENKKQIKRKRITEGADLPLAKIGTSEKAIALFKHGRAVEITYEALRRLRIDLFGKTIDAISSDVAMQEFDDAVDVLLNGDGNENVATKIGDTATADTVTAAEFQSACIDFWDATHLPVTTAVCGKEIFKTLAGLRYDTQLSEGASKAFTFDIPQIGTKNITLLLGNVPKIQSKNPLVLFNKDFAVNKYVESGSMIREYNSNIRDQTKLGTISDNSAFAKFLNNATMYLQSK